MSEAQTHFASEIAADAMKFTLIVEGFLRDDTGAEAITESKLIEAMYALRALIAEAQARELYDSWKDAPGWVPWVEGGNSHKQDDARRIAATGCRMSALPTINPDGASNAS